MNLYVQQDLVRSMAFYEALGEIAAVLFPAEGKQKTAGAAPITSFEDAKRMASLFNGR